MEPRFPALQADFFLSEPPEKLLEWRGWRKFEKITFNPSLNEEEQPTFQRLGKECSSHKERQVQGPKAIRS